MLLTWIDAVRWLVAVMCRVWHWAVLLLCNKPFTMIHLQTEEKPKVKTFSVLHWQNARFTVLNMYSHCKATQKHVIVNSTTPPPHIFLEFSIWNTNTKRIVCQNLNVQNNHQYAVLFPAVYCNLSIGSLAARTSPHSGFYVASFSISFTFCNVYVAHKPHRTS